MAAKPNYLTPLNNLFRDRQLSPLIDPLRQRMTLDAHWRAVAPENLADLSHVFQLENRVLTIAAANGAAALKLRQMAPTLRRKLQERDLDITSVRVIVRVLPGEPQKKPKRLEIPQSGAEQLDALAQSLPESGLKQAVARLARLAKKQQEK